VKQYYKNIYLALCASVSRMTKLGASMQPIQCKVKNLSSKILKNKIAYQTLDTARTKFIFIWFEIHYWLHPLTLRPKLCMLSTTYRNALNCDVNILQICIFNIFEHRNTTLIMHHQYFICIPLSFAFLSAIIRTNPQFLCIANIQYIALLFICLLLVSFIFPFAVVWNTDILSSDIKSCPFIINYGRHLS
jgi:hypothetical protein